MKSKCCIDCSNDVIRHHKGPRCTNCHNKNLDKKCSQCGNTKSSRWYKNDICGNCYSKNRYLANVELGRKRGRDWHQKNKEQRREYHLKKSYGMSMEEFNDLSEFYKHECMICHKKQKKLFVDHCHTTGMIRGLLCLNCNSLLGYSKDNITILLEAASYLKMREIIYEKIQNKQKS